MRVAKAKGRLRGKQPKLNPRQEARLVALLKSGEYSTAEIGDLFGVARSTVYRAIGRDSARQRAQRSGATPGAMNWRYPWRIATDLWLTPRTVESHVRLILSKLQLTCATEGHRRVLAVLAYLSAS
jgi:DNA-binding CsgD family transcriptional regulator